MFELMRPEPGAVVFPDLTVYEWPEGGEWLPAVKAWHADDADDIGLQVREIPDPEPEPTPEPEGPAEFVPTVTEASPDDVVVEHDDEVPVAPRPRPYARSKTVRPAEPEDSEPGEVTPSDVTVEPADAPASEPGEVAASDVTVAPPAEPENIPAPLPHADSEVTPDGA